MKENGKPRPTPNIDLPIPSDTTLRTAIDEARTVIADPALTYEGRADRIIVKISEMIFPDPAAETAMAQELRRYKDVGVGLRLNGDGPALLREAIKLGQRATELSRPIPTPAPPRTLDEAITRYRDLVARGWTTLEVEMLAVEIIRSQEDVISFDGTGAHTAKRKITRRWLRSVNAPVVEPYRTKYLNNFPPLPEEHEVKTDA